MSPIHPPSVIGIIGGGQLGMMTVREAHRMGYRTVVWDPDPACPASRIADQTITADFANRAAAERMANIANVITYEFENIDTDTVSWLEERAPLYPGSELLAVSQNRRREKEELRKRGFPIVSYEVASTRDDVVQVAKRLNVPCVAKTGRYGYDGKGQTVLRNPEDILTFLKHGGDGDFVVEEFITLEREISVIVARTKEGNISTFPIAENVHRKNILYTTTVPTEAAAQMQREALEIATAIAESFNLVGVLCVEMFISASGSLYVNELAPRPHNSGHYSLDACDISQFEALVRTVCGLSMHPPRLTSPCIMRNLLGDDLKGLDVTRLLEIPGVKLHLYGKKEILPRRKMGHVTVLGQSREEVQQLFARVDEAIEGAKDVVETFRPTNWISE